MIWAFMSSRISRVCTPLTEPSVPTGMKIGVSISPWSVVMMPALASLPGAVACNLYSINNHSINETANLVIFLRYILTYI